MLERDRSLVSVLMSDAIAADDDNVWILPLEKGMILNIKRNSGCMHLCGVIPNPNHLFLPYRFMFLYENELYLLPYNDNKILVFDIDKEVFRTIEIDVDMCGDKKCCRFTSYVLVEDLAIISGEFSRVLFFNLKDGGMRWIELKNIFCGQDEIDYWVWKYSYVNDGKVYLVLSNALYIVSIEIESGEVNYQKIRDDNCILLENPVIHEDRLYYFRRNELDSNLYEYNIALNTIQMHKTNACFHDIKFGAYGYVVYSNSVLWCLPGTIDGGVAYHIKRDKTEKLDHIPTISISELKEEYPYEFNYRNGFLTRDGHILLIHAWTEQLVDVDTGTGDVSVKKIYDSGDTDWNEVYKKDFLDVDNGVIKEWKDGVLESFLDYIIFENNESYSDEKMTDDVRKTK